MAPSLDLLEEIVFDDLDQLHSREIAEEWAYAIAGKHGSRETALILMIYTQRQQEPRKSEIGAHFNYLTNQQGVLDLQKILDSRD